jgi:hypothetical protein
VPLADRVIGFGLFALTLPIAVHYLLAYGVQLNSLRVAVHALAGCFFCGGFAAKVLLVRAKRLPGWLLPGARSPSSARTRGRRGTCTNGDMATGQWQLVTVPPLTLLWVVKGLRLSP